MHARETDRAKLRTMLVPSTAELLLATPVSKRVNSVRNDDAGCLGPLAAEAQGACS
jgi:hypothetical protein